MTTSLYDSHVSKSRRDRNQFPTPFALDCRQSFAQKLLNAVESDHNEMDRREKPLKEYDTGVEGFKRFCHECLRIQDKETGQWRPMQIWHKQEELVQMVLDNRRSAVMSGHSLGKSYLASALCLWWFCCRGLNFYTTAPRLDHVKGVIWKNIAELHASSARRLPGRVYPQPCIKVRGQDGWYGEGYSIGDQAENAAGYHDEGQLIVGDEAAGLNDKHFASFRSSMASDSTRLLLLGNGNHDRGTMFRRAFEDENLVDENGNKLYATMQMSSWDSPNVTCWEDGSPKPAHLIGPYIKGLATTEWCKEQKKLLEDDPDEYDAKIMGRWPKDDSAKKIIPDGRILAAMDLWDVLEEEEKHYVKPPAITQIFWDVAAEGEDKCALAYLRGQRVHIQRWWKISGEAALMMAAEEIAHWIRDMEEKPFWIAVDADAVGYGAWSKLVELKMRNPEWFGHCEVVKHQGSKASTDKTKFNNITTELHWRLRQRLDPTKPLHERIAIPTRGPDGLTRAEIRRQLNLREYDRDDLSRRAVEGKKSIKKRGAKSPDVADAIVGLMIHPEIYSSGFFA